MKNNSNDLKKPRAGFNVSMYSSGIFYVKCFDKDGKLKWEDTAKNAVTAEGLNHVLDVEFHAETQITTWYIGLIRDDSYSTLAAGDTLASHAGWQEGDEYTGDRKEWTEGAAAAGVMTNGSSVNFAINDTETMKGAFLCSAESGTSGILYCTALFTQGDRAVVSGDTLKVTYTITNAAA